MTPLAPRCGLLLSIPLACYPDRQEAQRTSGQPDTIQVHIDLLALSSCHSLPPFVDESAAAPLKSY